MATRNELEQYALKAIRRGDLHKAVRAYLAILKSDPRDRRIRQKLAELYFKLDRPVEGERYLRDSAELAVKEGQFRVAISIYKQLLQRSPRDGALHAALASCYAHLGIRAEAVRYYDAAANLLAAAGDHEGRVAALRRLVELEPLDTRYRFRLAEALVEAEKLDEARQAYEELARFLERRGQVGEVARVREALLELAPDDPELRLQAARARLEQGNAARAWELVQPLLELRPRDPAVLEVAAGALERTRPEQALPKLLALAELYRVAGEAEKRADVLRRALDIRGDEGLRRELAEARELVARLRHRLWDEAVLSPASDEELVACTRARVYLDYGFPEKAERVLREALGDPPRPSVEAWLIEVLLELGRRDEALERLRAAVERSTGQLRRAFEERLAALEGRSARPEPEAPAAGPVADDELIDDELIDDELIDGEAAAPPQAAPVGREPPRSAAPPEGGRGEAERPEPTAAARLKAEAEAALAVGELEQALDAFQRAYREDPSDQEVLLRIGELRRLQREARLREEPAPAPAGSSFDLELLDEDEEKTPEPASAPESSPEDDALSALLGLEGGEEAAPAEEPPSPSSGGGSVSAAEPRLSESGPLAQARALVEAEAWAEARRLAAEQDGLEARWIEARALAGLGKPERALKLLRGALADADEDEPAYGPALLSLARLYLRLGRLRGALRLVEELGELRPGWRERELADLARGLEWRLERGG